MSDVPPLGGRRVPVPQCPLRAGEPCTLCQLDVTGPANCGLVYLVMSDPQLRAGLRLHGAVRPATAMLNGPAGGRGPRSG
jgi:hypothetical protein